MIEKWRKSLDQGGAYGALPTDLPKAVDCLPRELIITKPYAFWGTPGLHLMVHYYST